MSVVLFGEAGDMSVSELVTADETLLISKTAVLGCSVTEQASAVLDAVMFVLKSTTTLVEEVAFTLLVGVGKNGEASEGI